MADSGSSGGVSLSTVLVAIFVTLKLTHVVDWSWWWVFSPWLIGTALVLLIVGLAAGVEAGLDGLDRRTRRPRRRDYTRPQDHDASHIEPLDSIKNPRKS